MPATSPPSSVEDGQGPGLEVRLHHPTGAAEFNGEKLRTTPESIWEKFQQLLLLENKQLLALDENDKDKC